MTVLFRCNADANVGYGHLTRCRALAQALRKHSVTCVMIGPEEADARPEDSEIFSDWITKTNWSSSTTDAAFMVDIANETRAEFAVLDDYRVDERYQLTLRGAGLRWLQFDGMARVPLWADFILNANPAAQPLEYSNVLRNPATRLLLGPSYAILRPEFAGVELRNLKRPVHRVLVTFGGGDDRGAIEFILSVLVPATPPTVEFLVISGSRNPRNTEIENWIAMYGQGRVLFVINPLNIAPLIASCDLALIAGGTTTFEVAYCELPMILITIAENQISQSYAWAAKGAAKYLGMLENVDSKTLVCAFMELCSSPVQRHFMANKGRCSVDGIGAKRVAQHICGEERLQ